MDALGLQRLSHLQPCMVFIISRKVVAAMIRLVRLGSQYMKAGGEEADVC